MFSTECGALGGGPLGPRLIAGPDTQVIWVNSLSRAPKDARVLCETGKGFEPWGPTRDALIYATISDLVLHQFERAQQDLARAAELNHNRWDLFPYNPQFLNIPFPLLEKRARAFSAWLTKRQTAGDLVAADAIRLRSGLSQLRAAVATDP